MKSYVSRFMQQALRLTVHIRKLAQNTSPTTLLFLFMLALVQPLWHGYQFGISDHALQFSFMNRIVDSTLYPNDPMLETAKGYVSFFPRLMVVLVALFGNMEALYFVLHIASYFLFFAVLYSVCCLLFDKGSAILCVILMSTSKITLGGSSVHFTGLYPSFFMLPVVLLAVYLFLREKYIAGYAIVGVALNFHMLISSYTFCMFLCYSALRLIGRRIGPKTLAMEVGAFVLCGLPAFIWTLSTHGEMTEEWIRLLRVRSSHHSFPLSWALSQHVNYLLFLSLGVLSFLYPPLARFHRKMLAFVLAIALLCAVGLIFAEYYPVKLVLRGQFFRSTGFLTIFCVAYVSNYLRRSWANSVLHKVTVLVSFLALFLPPYFNLLILGLILFLIAENAFVASEAGRRSSRLWISFFVLIAILVRSFSSHDSFPNSFNLDAAVNFLRAFLEERLLTVIVAAAIALMGVASLKGVYRKLGTAVIAAVLVVYVVPSAYGKLHPESRLTEGWRGVQIWAKENTEKTDIFLTPPYMTGFRIFSQRPIVGEWKDGTQQYFDTEYAYEWWRRMQDVKSPSWRNRDFDTLDTAAYQALAEKYGASYLVVPSSVSPDLPKAYDNGRYAVYRLDFRTQER